MYMTTTGRPRAAAAWARPVSGERTISAVATRARASRSTGVGTKTASAARALALVRSADEGHDGVRILRADVPDCAHVAVVRPAAECPASGDVHEHSTTT